MLSGDSFWSCSSDLYCIFYHPNLDIFELCTPRVKFAICQTNCIDFLQVIFRKESKLSVNDPHDSKIIEDKINQRKVLLDRWKGQYVRSRQFELSLCLVSREYIPHKHSPKGCVCVCGTFFGGGGVYKRWRWGGAKSTFKIETNKISNIIIVIEQLDT